MTKKKKKVSAKKIIAIGAGAAAAGAAAYYFLGPKGKKHQAEAKLWMSSMKKEIEEKIKKVKTITEPIYHNTVDALAMSYRKKYNNSAEEINDFAKKIKAGWKGVPHKNVSVNKKSVAKKVAKK